MMLSWHEGCLKDVEFIIRMIMNFQVISHIAGSSM